MGMLISAFKVIIEAGEGLMEYMDFGGETRKGETFEM
jgi:hypothetical protein